MTPEERKETIITVAKENTVLRWLTLFLTLGIVIAVAGSYFAFRKPQIVWFVTADGRITSSTGFFLDLEAEASVLRALESYYTPSQNREQRLVSFFSSAVRERPAFKKFVPSDRFVGFRVEKIEHGKSIEVSGLLMRRDSEEKLILVLERTDRSEINPFGLMVANVREAKEVKEPEKEGLSVEPEEVKIEQQKTKNSTK